MVRKKNDRFFLKTTFYFLYIQPGKKIKKSGSSGASSKRKSRAKAVDDRPEIDVLSPAAIINAYYICHNVSDCLNARGFKWEGAKKSKKKKKKKS